MGGRCESRVIAEGGDGGVHWVVASLPKTGAGVQSRPHKASEEITHFPQITLFLFSFLNIFETWNY